MGDIRCIECNRKLKTWKSRQLGRGPSCYKKFLIKMQKAQINIFDMQEITEERGK